MNRLQFSMSLQVSTASSLVWVPTFFFGDLYFILKKVEKINVLMMRDTLVITYKRKFEKSSKKCQIRKTLHTFRAEPFFSVSK